MLGLGTEDQWVPPSGTSRPIMSLSERWGVQTERKGGRCNRNGTTCSSAVCLLYRYRCGIIVYVAMFALCFLKNPSAVYLWLYCCVCVCVCVCVFSCVCSCIYYLPLCCLHKDMLSSPEAPVNLKRSSKLLKKMLLMLIAINVLWWKKFDIFSQTCIAFVVSDWCNVIVIQLSSIFIRAFTFGLSCKHVRCEQRTDYRHWYQIKKVTGSFSIIFKRFLFLF